MKKKGNSLPIWTDEFEKDLNRQVDFSDEGEEGEEEEEILSRTDGHTHSFQPLLNELGLSNNLSDSKENLVINRSSSNDESGGLDD